MSSAISVELRITKGDQVGRRYALRLGQRFVIGRAQKVAIRLADDPLISRQHASLELRTDGLFLIDMGSRNGTSLDGTRLEPNRPVDATSSRCVEVGNHVLEIRSLGAPTSQVESESVGPLPQLPAVEFQIMGLIGEGTTGAVYAGEQKLLRRKVAIKVLVGDAEDELKRERFLREGWICSQIQSPHVVDIYDVRIFDGQVCMIMELVQGPSVKDRLRDGPLPLVEVLGIGEHVALALQAASEAGIVHRDVKPSNILLDPTGVAKLSDFGIAKGPLETAGLTELTPSGHGLGTYAYVSPEQALDARNVDPRSDVYALGATLYHMLAGHPPFRPENPAELYKTFDQEPTPLTACSDLNPTPPAELCDLIQLMLSKAPEKRPGPFSLLARLLHEMRVELFPDAGSSSGIDETGSFPRVPDSKAP